MPWFADNHSRFKGPPDYRLNRWKGQNNSLLDGKQRIASSYRPQARKSDQAWEPYYSGCPDTIGNHVVQMCDAGIDGVVVDWYGIGTHKSKPIVDFEIIHTAAQSICERIESMQSANCKFKFALCFDANCQGNLATSAANAQSYIEDSLRNAAKVFMRNNCYLKHGEEPVLFLFGDPHAGALRNVDWSSAIDAVQNTLAIDGGNGRIRIVAQLGFHDSRGLKAGGVFSWLPVRHSGELDQIRMWEDVASKLKDDYHMLSRCHLPCISHVRIGIAFPGVRDIYLEDGRPSEHLETIRRRAGSTLRDTLELAHKQEHLDFVQVATFNDWNEGTKIEPAEGYGARELDTVKSFADEGKER